MLIDKTTKHQESVPGTNAQFQYAVMSARQVKRFFRLVPARRCRFRQCCHFCRPCAAPFASRRATLGRSLRCASPAESSFIIPFSLSYNNFHPNLKFLDWSAISIKRKHRCCLGRVSTISLTGLQGLAKFEDTQIAAMFL